MDNVLRFIYSQELDKDVGFCQTVMQHVQGYSNNTKHLIPQHISSSPPKIILENIFPDAFPPKPTTSTSYALGQQGQDFVHEILKDIFPDIQNCSRTGHMGDLSATHMGRTYMFEIKNKLIITNDDVQKFLDDGLKYDVSILLSLQTTILNDVTKTFDFKFQSGKLYIMLSKSYVNKEVLTLMRDFVGTQLQLYALQQENGEMKTQKEFEDCLIYDVKYQLQQSDMIAKELQLLTQLYVDEQTQLDKVDKVRESIKVKQQVVKQMVEVFTPQQYKNKTFQTQLQTQQLQMFLKQTARKNVRKATLEVYYDKLGLGALTMDEIYEKYCV